MSQSKSLIVVKLLLAPHTPVVQPDELLIHALCGTGIQELCEVGDDSGIVLPLLGHGGACRGQFLGIGIDLSQVVVDLLVDTLQLIHRSGNDVYHLACLTSQTSNLSLLFLQEIAGDRYGDGVFTRFYCFYLFSQLIFFVAIQELNGRSHLVE